MKSILFVLFLLHISNLAAQTKEIIELRNLSSGSSIETSYRMNVILETFNQNSSITVGYRGIAELIRAKGSNQPIEKIQRFKNGRRLLEQSIQTDKNSIELRYLRFCVQTNVPFYLNYSSNIEEDKLHILRNWNKIQDSDLKKRIKSYMIRSEYCNDDEKKHFIDG